MTKAATADFLARGPVRWTAFLLLAVLLGAFTYYAAHNPIDYGPYPATTRAMLAGSQELYGPHSGLGWPMVYRSGPLFLFLFMPFALLPVHIGAGLWVVLKFVALYAVILMLHTMRRQDSPSEGRLGAAWLVAFFICASYVVQEFRSGNMQFFVFACAVAGFYFLRPHPAWSGAFFALGTSIKLIPGFFIPYLLVRGHRRMASYFALFLILFLLLPAFYFGFNDNLQLLESWWRVGISEPTPTKWGTNPDHSLRGVMTRYLSTIVYEHLPDPNYRNINFAEVPPPVLLAVWLTLFACAYAALLFLASRLRKREKLGEAPAMRSKTELLEYGLLFCAQLLLAPLTQRIYLVALLFPALVLSHELARLPKGSSAGRVVRGVACLAVLFFALPPLVPGSVNQRLIAVYSPDFWGTLLLAVTLVLLLRMRTRTPGAEGAV